MTFSPVSLRAWFFFPFKAAQLSSRRFLIFHTVGETFCRVVLRAEIASPIVFVIRTDIAIINRYKSRVKCWNGKVSRWTKLSNREMLFLDDQPCKLWKWKALQLLDLKSIFAHWIVCSTISFNKLGQNFDKLRSSNTFLTSITTSEYRVWAVVKKHVPYALSILYKNYTRNVNPICSTKLSFYSSILFDLFGWLIQLFFIV